MGILSVCDGKRVCVGGGGWVRWGRIQGCDLLTPQQHPILGHIHKHVLLGEEVEINLTLQTRASGRYGTAELDRQIDR